MPRAIGFLKRKAEENRMSWKYWQRGLAILAGLQAAAAFVEMVFRH